VTITTFDVSRSLTMQSTEQSSWKQSPLKWLADNVSIFDYLTQHVCSWLFQTMTDCTDWGTDL